MKLIMAITQPQRLGAVRAALRIFGAGQLTVTEILQTVPPDRRRTEFYRGVPQPLCLAPRVRLEIVAKDGDAYDLMRVIASAVAAEGPAEATVCLIHAPAAFAIRTGRPMRLSP